jgi:hypothetical protein
MRCLAVAAALAWLAEGVLDGGGGSPGAVPSPIDQERSRLHVVEVHKSLDGAPKDVLESGMAVQVTSFV